MTSLKYLQDALKIITDAEVQSIRETMTKMSREEYNALRQLQRVWIILYRQHNALQFEIFQRQAWPHHELEITASRFNEITGLEEDVPSDDTSDDTSEADETSE